MPNDKIMAEKLVMIGELELGLNSEHCIYPACKFEKGWQKHMRDGVGREINYMRISITDRCNLRCRYCMPNDIESIEISKLLTYEDIVKVVESAATIGIRYIRLTGGEPLVRRGCVFLVKKIKNIPGIDEVGLTTNGVLLAEYAEALKKAGLSGVNVSLDTLDQTEFEVLTGKAELHSVLLGIETAKAAGLSVKLNTVNRKELNFKSILEYASKMQIPVRFIEMMPIGYGIAYMGKSNEKLLKQIEACYGEAVQTKKHGPGPAVYYHFERLNIDVGFISAINHKFCSSCNRIRLTSEGYLKLCLCYEKGLDLRKIIRDPKKEKLLQETLKKAIMEKPVEHCFEQQSKMTEHMAMMQIGG